VSPATYAAAVALWFVMMAVMMLPVLWPWLRLFRSMAPRAWPRRRPALVVLQFGAGYLVAWLGYSVVAAALQGGLQRVIGARIDPRAHAVAIGFGLLLAGAFQLTPLKDACLAHCRSPMSFFLERWDGGPAGPFRMGARHGVFCVGCCWALMALMFVFGAMNLLWMAALTALMAAEQRAPRAWRLRQASGVGLSLWGVLLLLAG
jgi:predicted metal-binding membrane protein